MMARKWTNEEYANVLKLHREGAKNSDLARSLGLSHQRVRDVIRTAERLETMDASNDPMNLLSARTRNALRSEELRTVESVREAVFNGKIDNIPNFGEVSKTEVLRWLDI